MVYRKFHDMDISHLGMGCMRLPKQNAEGEAVDVAKAEELIAKAQESGINYYDSAYRYHGGESELIMGKALSRFKRETYHIATKMPGHMMSYQDGKYTFTGMLSGAPPRTPAEVFEEQLEKCRVDYFDLYLLHNVSENSFAFYTNEEIGIIPLLLEQKKKGRIRHLGFSSHGRSETLEKFLDYSDSRFSPGIFEAVQIQLNYLDWTVQNARRKYECLTARGIPVIAMEPVRGGRLASFSEESGAEAVLKALRPNDTAASWAVRYVKSLPNVQVVLSGMSSLGQLEDNLKTIEEPGPLSEKEYEAIREVVSKLANLVPCTSCRYCCEECPQKLDIPRLISMENEIKNGRETIWKAINFTLSGMKESELPSSCVDCGNCKQVCPQNIDVPEIMRSLAEGIKRNRV